MKKVPVRRSLELLAHELGVSLTGLDDDQIDHVAIRFVLDGRVTTSALQAIVDDVRDGSGQATVGANIFGSSEDLGSTPTQEPALPPARKMHYLATEATAAKMRHRLRLAHQAEDSRAALYVVPRTPDRLPADKPHPACLSAAREGRYASVCKLRCQWLLNEDDPYTEFWLDRDDDLGGRL